MNHGYWFMLGGLLCFSGVGVVHKLGDRFRCNPLHVAFLTMGFAFLVTGTRATVPRAGWLGALPPKVA